MDYKYAKHAICETCGHYGAYLRISQYYCGNCLEDYEKKISEKKQNRCLVASIQKGPK